jgi:hypothetical protein
VGERELSLEDWTALAEHAVADCSGAALGVWSMMRARGPFAGTRPDRQDPAGTDDATGQRPLTSGAAGS